MSPNLTIWSSDPEAEHLAAALAAAALAPAVRVPGPAEGGHTVLGSGAVSAWLQQRPAAVDAPVSAFGPVPVDADLPELLSRGLTGWWPAGTLADPAALHAALAFDQARWQQAAELRAELARARGQLDERKWVDRAKGVLMSARGIGEDEAFRLLRGAAMHANLRMGEVSRSVTEASQWAEAINRAGQLRMLSQRLVKLVAQRLANIDARRSRTLQDEAAQRVQGNFDHLSACPPLIQAPQPTREALAAAEQAWGGLKRALAQRQTVETLADCDQRAMTLLDRADELTEALEEGGARRALKVVNLCGRQRMRVQRVAKDALLAALLNEPARQAALTPVLDEAEATLLELERMPLASPESREALAIARDEWLRLLRGLRAADNDGCALVAASSDALLEVFDRLTASYERSLQVIMS